MSAVFSTRSATVKYAGAATAALVDLSIDVERGRLFAVIGPNGSGKSTLVRALLGVIHPDAGEVSYEGRSIRDWPRRELARRVGVVAQIEDMAFPVTVRELVAMGRYPHLGALRTESAVDRAAVEAALQRCDVIGFADRSVASLSGGERQRARIARALAQQPETLVLDEPTVALDIAHEMVVFDLIRSLTRDEGCTVVITTHHINLAARYADTLLLLDRGRSAACGPAADVIRKEILEATYGWPLSVHPYDGAGFDHGAPQVAPLSGGAQRPTN